MSEASRGTEWGKVENLDTPCEYKAAGGQAQCSLRTRIWLSAGDWQGSTGDQGRAMMLALAVYQVDPFGARKPGH